VFFLLVNSSVLSDKSLSNKGINESGIIWIDQLFQKNQFLFFGFWFSSTRRLCDLIENRLDVLSCLALKTVSRLGEGGGMGYRYSWVGSL
jgi:hypothetical protein